MYLLNACPRCGGTLHNSWLDDDDLMCLQCGFVRTARPAIAPSSSLRRRREPILGPRARRKRKERVEEPMVSLTRAWTGDGSRD